MLGDDDLDIFFDDLSIPVTFRLAGVEIASLDGLFNPSGEIVSPYQAEITVSRPELWCKTAEVAAIGQQHTLIVDGVEYRQFGAPLVQGPFTRFVLVK